MDYLRFLTIGRLAKAAYGVVVALVLAEIGIALFVPQQEALQKDLIERDPDLGFRMRPQYRGTLNETDIPLHINAWGLRDREYGPKAPDTLRIYAIGDSMVFGHGVPIEETFPRYMEKILAERLSRPVEVVNGGVPGYGTVQAAEFFAQTVDLVDPDVVLLSIAVFNDLEDNVKFGKQLYRWQRDPSLFQRWRTWLRHNSQVYRMFRRYRAGVSGRQMMQIHSDEPPPRVQRGIDLTEQSLVRIAEIADERDIAFAVVVNPAHKQASAGEWADTLLRYQLDPNEFRYDHPNRLLVSVARAHGLPILDLLEVFRSRPEENYYFSEHWKAPGHQLVAREISSFLFSNRLVDRRPVGREARDRFARNGSDSAGAPPQNPPDSHQP